MLLMDSFISAGFCPKVIRNGRRFKLISIEQLSIKIVPSYNYFTGDEFYLSELFDISFEPLYFPYKFLNIENLNYHGSIPLFSYFEDQFDSEHVRHKKQTFYLTRVIKNSNWCLLKELEIFCDFKLNLLIMAILKFLKECCILQRELHIKMGKSNFETLHPFSSNLISLSAFIYNLFRLLYLSKFDIRIVKYEYGFPIRKVSQQEYEWTSFWIFNNPGKACLTAFNNPIGQKYFNESIPDLYDIEDKHCYYYNGCYTHMHYDNCSINSTATENSRAPNGMTYKEINDAFWSKMNALILNNPKYIDKITITWECSFYKIKSTERFQLFSQKCLKKHPLVRLCARDCFRGAYFDVCAHKWSRLSFPDEKLYFLDIVGLYSHVTMTNTFMTGKYKIVIGEDLTNLKITNNCFYYKDLRISGAILLTILPPQNLLHPFLMYKTKQGRTVLTLCRSCCETFSKNCKHNCDQRSLTGSYMISEIEFSLNLGYRIIDIFECHAYFESDLIFRPFVQALTYFKQINSLDKKSATIELCNKLNENLEDSDFKYEHSAFNYNPSKRNLHKFLANSLFGKIGQRSDYKRTVYVSSQEELEALYFSTDQIEEITCLNDAICQVVVKPLLKRSIPNRNANCYLAAQVTAYARAEIYRHIMTVKLNPNAVIYYIDCDCIVFSLPEADQCPLTISPKCGDFKIEYDEISNFLTLGTKSYIMCFTKDEVPQRICKVKGLQLNYSGEKIDEKLFEFYIDAFLKKKNVTSLIEQNHYVGDFKHMRSHLKQKFVSFSNNISVPRILMNNQRVTSVPYGYNHQ